MIIYNGRFKYIAISAPFMQIVMIASINIQYFLDMFIMLVFSILHLAAIFLPTKFNHMRYAFMFIPISIVFILAIVCTCTSSSILLNFKIFETHLYFQKNPTLDETRKTTKTLSYLSLKILGPILIFDIYRYYSFGAFWYFDFKHPFTQIYVSFDLVLQV